MVMALAKTMSFSRLQLHFNQFNVRSDFEIYLIIFQTAGNEGLQIVDELIRLIYLSKATKIYECSSMKTA